MARPTTVAFRIWLTVLTALGVLAVGGWWDQRGELQDTRRHLDETAAVLADTAAENAALQSTYTDLRTEVDRLGVPVTSPPVEDIVDDPAVVIQGPRGDTGPAGARGATGPAGPPPPCTTAPDACVGARGPTGERGPAGAVGAVGATGPRGEQGAPGDVGAQGPPGETVIGPPGATGPPGPPGEAAPIPLRVRLPWTLGREIECDLIWTDTLLDTDNCTVVPQ